ncbi:zinc finger protein [Gracilaria domingensis]|nr:zinc finger protein [Gracilaria domingensis]
MSILPKLKIEGLSNLEVEDNLISPVTPATVEHETSSRENDRGNKRRRIGGLPISALVNEKDDDSPVPYPGEHQPPFGTEAVTPGRPEFPSILYQMSEFVTQLEERAVQGSLPTLKSLGLPKPEELVGQGLSKQPADCSQSHPPASTTRPNEIGSSGHSALPPLKALRFPTSGHVASHEVSGKLTHGSHLRAQEPTLSPEQNEASGNKSLPRLNTPGLTTTEEAAAQQVSQKSADDGILSRGPSSFADSKENYAPEEDEVVAVGSGNNLARPESEDRPKASSRKRTRAERDLPITTEPEIETLINKLREKEQSRMGESNNKASPQSSNDEADAEVGTPSSTGPSGRNQTPGISRSSKITKEKKQRRGRPNGDSRPRPHACPTCQRRFHQQSGVVNHYRVVHLKEKRFECPHKCGLKFGARGDVTRHVDAVHNKLRNFECQVCGDAFARKSILTRHCKNMHNDVFGAGEAHDCVHGCVYRPRSRRDGEESEGDQK